MEGIREDCLDDIEITPDSLVRFALPHCFIFEMRDTDFFVVVETADEFEDAIGLVCHFLLFQAVYFNLNFRDTV
jgi:hypothetical protein